MDSATITGLRSLKLSEMPVNSDQDLPSTQASTPVDQAHLAGHQDHIANSLASDASDVPSSPVLPPTSPDIQRFPSKLHPSRFRKWTGLTHLKDKAMKRENRKQENRKQENRKQEMNDFPRKEGQKEGQPPGTRDSKAAGLAEVGTLRRLDPEAQTTTTRKWARELDAILHRPDGRTEDFGVAGKPPKKKVEKTAHLPTLADVPTAESSRVVAFAAWDDEIDVQPLPAAGSKLSARNARRGAGDSREESRAIKAQTHSPGASSYDKSRSLRESRHEKLPGLAPRYDPFQNMRASQYPTTLTTRAVSRSSIGDDAPYLAPISRRIKNDRSNSLEVDPELHTIHRQSANPPALPLLPLSDYPYRQGMEVSLPATKPILQSYDVSDGIEDLKGASNTDSPDSSHDTHPQKQNALGNTSQASCNQSSDSSRTTVDPGPIQGHEDNSRVRTDTRQARNNEEAGKVIPCPLRLELKCAGMDDNMSSLLRELSNSTHNIFYCNRCKSLLSRINRNDDAELLRRLRKESKVGWQVHLRSCHDDHCVMSACAPQLADGVRHKRNENCKTNREDEKEADANYLYGQLGVAQLGVEIGSKTNHKGKRRSTARKMSKIAEDAAQSIVELESELRARNCELEVLKEVDREHCRQINELRSANEEHCRQINELRSVNEEHCRRVFELRSANGELSSIIRHALEDMRRENVNLTNALHDRIERHAPSALWPQPTPTQPPWMNVDQNMADLDGFDPQIWEDLLGHPQINQ